jgi:shikimate kinase/3-dehydroquinate synthase
MPRDSQVLLLNGFMGAGKTTVGRLVAARAGVPFVDLDAAVEQRAGKSIPELFASEGEPAFRAREAEELARILAEPGKRVVALGGGALLDRSRRRAALDAARVVTLAAAPETLAARTARTGGVGRPLLDREPDRVAAVREILGARREAYAEAHAVIPTDSVAEGDVAKEVLAAWARPTVAVPLGLRSYAVRFSANEPDAVGAVVAPLTPSQVFVVTDATVDRHWGASLEAGLASRGVTARAKVVLEPGEEQKHLGSVELALRAMVTAGADRDAVVVGHGGGVVTDIAGFVAACLLRGVRWVGVPTTLLAMVDASVGGKTGVDLGAAKNAVGAFHQPGGVVVDVGRVKTETPRAYASGLAEVVKAGCIGDAALFEELEAGTAPVLQREPSVVEAVAFRAVSVKAGIVARDEREDGERALLNFGHTVGHALEAEGGFHRLTHGEAVALGMVAALRIGVRLGVTPQACAARVVELLGRLGLPVDLDAQPLAAALPLVGLDKKRRRGAVRFILLGGLGEAIVHPLDPASLAALLS